LNESVRIKRKREKKRNNKKKSNNNQCLLACQWQTAKKETRKFSLRCEVIEFPSVKIHQIGGYTCEKNNKIK